MKIYRLIGLLLIGTMVLGGCGTPGPMSTSELDDPLYNAKQGMRHLEEGNLEMAMASFERALAMDKKCFQAYYGRGLVYLELDKLDKAMDNMKKAYKLGRKHKYYLPYIGMARILIAQGEYSSARAWCERLLRREPNNADACYWIGKTYEKEERYDKAREWYAQAIDKNPKHVKADYDWKKMDMILRAQPGTDVGKQIAMVDEITRADLAALFAEELDAKNLLRERKFKEKNLNPLERQKLIDTEHPIMEDIKGTWAEGYIQTVTDLNIMPPYPDGDFRPFEIINRANFCVFVQNIMIRYNADEELGYRFVGNKSPFTDVRGSNYAFNSILLCTSYGILQGDPLTHEFRPMDSVSGAEALLALRQLKQSLK